MKESSRNRGAELQELLVAELRTLRGAVREAGESFILRKEGEIESLLGYLVEMSPAEVERFGRAWLREARDLSIKPTKGRIKDLRRIDALLEDLLDHVIAVDAAAEAFLARPKQPQLSPEVIRDRTCGAADPP